MHYFSPKRAENVGKYDFLCLWLAALESAGLCWEHSLGIKSIEYVKLPYVILGPILEIDMLLKLDIKKSTLPPLIPRDKTLPVKSIRKTQLPPYVSLSDVWARYNLSQGVC
ncbi:hypothetical protein EGW08_009898 [Elysia chlorotica]|uniref:Uncharacterized protein n=1 Tax=Elysia chlorotica TaxID=188477 RepID=A0A433TLD9_ELYCH|nr:hypothetical protein EGW08_009898 [Elysia chlorotica]